MIYYYQPKSTAEGSTTFIQSPGSGSTRFQSQGQSPDRPAIPSYPALHKGDHINYRYEIISPLVIGEISHIYKALDHMASENVLLQNYHPDFANIDICENEEKILTQVKDKDVK